MLMFIAKGMDEQARKINTINEPPFLFYLYISFIHLI